MPSWRATSPATAGSTWPSPTRTDDTVSVLLSNGDGTFQPQVTYAVGSYPVAIVAGDFTGDGRTSTWPSPTRGMASRCCWATATARSSPRRPSRRGSHGAWWRVTSPATATSTWPSLTQYGDDTMSVLLGNGDGTFQPQVTYAVGTVPDAIVAGDFTGNGHLDLAVANHGSDNVSVLLGNGDGTFQPQVTYAVGSGPDAHRGGGLHRRRPPRPGRRQRRRRQLDGTVSVLLGNGDGTFQPQVTYAVGAEPDRHRGG